MTVASALRAVLDEHRMNERRAVRCTEYRTRLHLLPAFGDRELASLTRADLLAYASTRHEQGAKNATIRREFAILRRAYTLLELAPPRFPTLKEAQPRSDFLSADELARVLDVLPYYARGPVEFAYLTSWRFHSEVLTLTWEQVDFEGGIVRLLRSKNGEGREFPMIPRLRAILEARAELRLGDHVFHRRGKPVRCIRRVWKAACQRAGVEGRRLHGLRRSAVRNFVRAGIPRRVAMKLSGHRTESVFERYNITDASDLAVAAEKLTKLLG